jgi:predicted flap endonuclease-1-like 5' DNA nuclease
MATNIKDIEGIGDAYAEKLEAAGIKTVEGLLEAGASEAGRKKIEEQTGLAHAHVLKWVNHADLFRIKGVAGQFSELLEAAGVDTVPELAQRNAANLTKKMEEVNAEKNLANRTPSEAEVGKWIDEAKSLPRVVTH